MLQHEVRVQPKDVLSGVQERSHLYETLAALPFEVRSGAVTMFDHTTQTVVIGVEQLMQKGITDQRCLDFIILHELGHFKELSEDPDGFMTVIDEADRSDGLGRAYFNFYNVLMDIYVNTNTRNKAPIYGAGDFSPEIKELYRDKLFAERNFSELPFSKQYIYYLLNLGMGVESDLTLSSEVREMVEEPLHVLGQPYETKEIIDTFLRPALGQRRSVDWSASLSQRKWVIDQTFRPVFERLVAIDQEAGRDPNQGWNTAELVEVEASPEDLKNAIGVVRERRRQESRSRAESIKDGRARTAERLASEHLSPEEAEGFTQTYTRIEVVMYELAALLKRLAQRDVEYKQEERGYFRSGSSLDIDQAVREWGTIATVPENAQVMRRAVYREVATTAPREVRVWLNLDLSGSMSDDIQLLRDLSVVFSGALQTLSVGAKLGQHQLRGSLGIVGFNSALVEILPLTKDPSFSHIAAAYKYLVPAGDTHEYHGLERIVEETRRDPPSTERVDIVIGITDGDTVELERSIECIGELESLGAKVFAFHFTRRYVPRHSGVVSRGADAQHEAPHGGEQGTFERVWGARGCCVRRADQVLPAVRRQLRDLLRKGEGESR